MESEVTRGAFCDLPGVGDGKHMGSRNDRIKKRIESLQHQSMCIATWIERLSERLRGYEEQKLALMEKKVSVEEGFKVLSNLEYENVMKQISLEMQAVFERFKLLQNKRKEHTNAIRNLQVSDVTGDGKLYVHLDEEFHNLEKHSLGSPPKFSLNYGRLFSSMQSSIEGGVLAGNNRQVTGRQQSSYTADQGYKEKYKELKASTEELVSSFQVELNAYKKALDESREELRKERRRGSEIAESVNENVTCLKKELELKETALFKLEESVLKLEGEKTKLQKQFAQRETEKTKFLQSQLEDAVKEKDKIASSMGMRLLSLSLPSSISGGDFSFRPKNFCLEFKGPKEAERQIQQLWADVCDFLEKNEKLKNVAFNRALVQMKQVGDDRYLQMKCKDASSLTMAEESFQKKLNAMQTLYEKEKEEMAIEIQKKSLFEEKYTKACAEVEKMRDRTSCMDDIINEKISAVRKEYDDELRKCRKAHEEDIANISRLNALKTKELVEAHEQEILKMDQIQQHILASNLEDPSKMNKSFKALVEDLSQQK
eukprot:Nk52_evm43s1129 gene=Nk52_evmTU43s1129